jgi:TetR/AcrR family transcriptional regulator, cholesterol catabolism regulator
MPRVIKHPDIRRAEILGRASALFVERDYDNVSLNDLIADAGVSKGAFYQWFPSKDALITALAQRAASEQFAAIEDAVNRCGGNALDRLNAGLQAGFDVKMRIGIRAASGDGSAAASRECAPVRKNCRAW